MQITTTGNFPSDSGITPKGSFILSILGGTGLTASIEVSINGTWMALPNGEDAIDAAGIHTGVSTDGRTPYRINVSAISTAYEFSANTIV